MAIDTITTVHLNETVSVRIPSEIVEMLCLRDRSYDEKKRAQIKTIGDDKVEITFPE